MVRRVDEPCGRLSDRTMAARSASLALVAALALGCSEDLEARDEPVADSGTTTTPTPTDSATTTDTPVETGPTCAADDFTKPFDIIPSEFDINTELGTTSIPKSAA